MEAIILSALERCVLKVNVDQRVSDILVPKNVLDPKDALGLVILHVMFALK